MTIKNPDMTRIENAMQEWEDRFAQMDPTLLDVGGYITYSENDKVLGRQDASVQLAKRLKDGRGKLDASLFPSEYLDTIISASAVSFNDMKYMPEKARRRIGRSMALSIALVEWYYYDNPS